VGRTWAPDRIVVPAPAPAPRTAREPDQFCLQFGRPWWRSEPGRDSPGESSSVPRQSAFSLRPEVYGAWRQLNGAVKANTDLRRYELATVAVARRLRSSYCTLAHGSVPADKFLEPDAVRAVVEDYRSAGLAEADVAVMDLADNVPQAPRRRRRSGQDCVISLRARWCSMTNSLGGRRRPDRDHDRAPA
jgi:alkylhydroperoxidase family enzyme